MSACCVYRVFDIAGTLLYVGSSVSPTTRYRAHEYDSPWWPFKCDVREEWFPTEREARAAELNAIATEHPRWNVRGRDNEAHPDGPVSGCLGRFSTPHLREEIELWREWIQVKRDLERAQHHMAALKERIHAIAVARAPHFRDDAA